MTTSGISHAPPTGFGAPLPAWPWVAGATALLAVGVAAALSSPLLGLVCLALPAAPLLVLAPEFAILGLAAVLPFDALTGLGESAVVSLTRLVGLAVLGGWVLHVIAYKKRVRVGGPAMLLAAYVAFAAVSVAWAADTSVTLQGLRTLAQLFLLAVMAANVLDGWTRIARVLDVLLVATALLAVATLLQVRAGGERAVITYGAQVYHSNGLAAALALPALAAVALRSRTGPLGGWRLLALAPILPALVATGSRGGMLAFVAGLAVVAVCRPRLGLRAGAVVGVALLALPLVLPTRTIDLVRARWEATGEDRLSGRVDIWRVGLAMVADNPLHGTGFFGFRDAFYDYMLETPVDPHFALIHSRGNRAAHNIYLSTVAELGLAGGLLLLAALAAHARLLWRLWQAARVARHEVADDVALALLAMVVALVVAGAGSDVLLTKVPWLLFGAAQGAAFAAGWDGPAEEAA